MTFEQALDDLKRRHLGEFVPLQERHNNFYVCPICGSGTGPKKTPAFKIDPITKHVMCFSGLDKCFGTKGQDTPGALQRIWNCTLPEVLKRAGYDIETTTRAREGKKMVPTKPAVKIDPKPEPVQVEYTDRYKAWNKALLENSTMMENLRQWGINDDAVTHFLIGYNPQWVHPKCEKYNNATRESRIIFPRSPYTYSARVSDRAYIGEGKYKVVGKQKTLFNAEVLREDDTQPIIVVEGEIDAILIWQMGNKVIGLGSTSNKDTFVEAAKATNPNAVYILALDNDDGGRDAQTAIANALDIAGIAYICADAEFLYHGKKDAGEAIPEDQDGFISRLVDYYEQSYNLMEERESAAEIEAYNRSGAGMVDSFLQEIRTERFKPISSGIASLDEALGGGFINQSVILIGAAPGMGKTALVSQICENIARTGAGDILYINLEMSRQLLLARSISRLAYENGYDISAREIMRGYEWDSEIEKAVAKAAEEYKNTIAGHLIYNPGDHSNDLDVVMAKIEAEQRRIGHAPIVCLDYLQLLTGKKGEDDIDVIKRAMQTLKNYANENNTIVFVVVANNRESNKTGKSDINSGRDSSNIEYGADVHIGIEYEAVRKTIVWDEESSKWKVEKGVDLEYLDAIKYRYSALLREDIPREWWEEEQKQLEELYNQYCTRFIIRVNKNRSGDGGAATTLSFNGAASRFDEAPRIRTTKNKGEDKVVVPASHLY